VLRPDVNDPITVSADCAPTEQVIGGGTRADASDPTDTSAMHLQESGPTPSGWLGRVAATSRFKPGSVLTVTVTAFCLQP